MAFGSARTPLARGSASPQPPLSGSRKLWSKLLCSQTFATGTNPRGSSRALQLPDAFRKLSLLLRRYAHWDTGPRNPASVAFSCICIQWRRSLSCRPRPRRALPKSSGAMRLLSDQEDAISIFRFPGSEDSIRPPRLHEYITSPFSPCQALFLVLFHRGLWISWDNLIR